VNARESAKWYRSGKANNHGLRAIKNNCCMGYILPADIRARPVGIKRLTVDAKTEGEKNSIEHIRCPVSHLSRQCSCNRCTFSATSRQRQHGLLGQIPGHVQHIRNILSPTFLLQKVYNTSVMIDHLQSGVVYNISCLSVCQTITFESLDIRSSFSFIWYTFGVYGSSSYMKVTGSRSRPREQKKH